MALVHAAVLRRLLGRSDNRVDAVRFLVAGGPSSQAAIARSLQIAAPTAKEMLERLEKDGFVTIHNEGVRPEYRATPLAESLIKCLDGSTAAADALVGTVIVCAARPRGRADGSLLEAMCGTSGTVLGGFGTFQYVGIYPNDPEVLGALQGRIEELGSEPAAFVVSQVSRASGENGFRQP